MLLDTGADISLVPRLVVNALNVAPAPANEVRLTAFGGTSSTAEAAQVQIEFFGKTFNGAFVVTDYTQGIIGRDTLNLLSFHFDGPNLFWDEMPR